MKISGIVGAVCVVLSLVSCREVLPTEHGGRDCDKDSVKAADTTLLSGVAFTFSCDTAATYSDIRVSIDGTDYRDTTGADGLWSFAGLPYGMYDLTFEKEGYITDHVLGVEISNSWRRHTNEIGALSELHHDTAIVTSIVFQRDSFATLERVPDSLCGSKLCRVWHYSDSAWITFNGKVQGDGRSPARRMHVALTTTAGINEQWDLDLEANGSFRIARALIGQWLVSQLGSRLELIFTPIDCSETTWYDFSRSVTERRSSPEPTTRLTVQL